MWHVKEVPWKIILFYLLVNVVMVSLINLVLFPSQIFTPISRATGNLIDATLQANLLNIALFCIFFFAWGKLRTTDVGLRWHGLPQAIFLTILLWGSMQGIILLVNWINGNIHLDPIWSERGVTPMIGALLGQLFGNALFEEMLYRGLYMPQFFQKLKTPNETRRAVWAVLIMLGIFILSHIPNRIFHGYRLSEMPLDFALLFVWGLFFTVIYLVSGNLFLAVGVHALVNRPTMITEANFPPQALLLVLTFILLIFLRKRSQSRQNLNAGRDENPGVVSA